MDARASNVPAPATAKPQRLREFFVFLLLAVLIWPFITVGVVAG
jgi:nitrate reductase NapE component